MAGIMAAPADYDLAKDVVNRAADLMSMPRSHLDHSIWRYMADNNRDDQAKSRSLSVDQHQRKELNRDNREYKQRDAPLSDDSRLYNDCQKLAIVMGHEKLTMNQIRERMNARFGRNQTMTDHIVPDEDYGGAGGRGSTCSCKPRGCILHANGYLVLSKDAVFTSVRLRGQNVLASLKHSQE